MTLSPLLAIDTSCDETAVAVVSATSNTTATVHSNVIASQVELHKPYGGVFPTIAKLAHQENIDRCIALALKRIRFTWSDIKAIAVTQGPGLAPALEVGIRTAESYAQKYGLPVIPVNHIEGHVVSVLAQPNSTTAQPKTSAVGSTWPALSVIVSGGHTEFILVREVGHYQRVGWTIDDAAGEALDKVGRMLDLGYPAGPVMEEFARRGDAKKYAFPLPMTTSRDYNLSFSGLKTFARRMIESQTASGDLDKQAIYDLCASFQYATFRHICHKLSKVLNDNPDLGQVWLGGGVAANATLRQMLRQTIRQHIKDAAAKKISLPLSPKILVPYSKKLCGDNAAMIGTVAVLNKKLPKIPAQKVSEKIDRRPRWEVC